MSTVTFVVLTNDEERTISRRLWELRHQDADPATVESIEVVVVDGNSTDRTLLLAVPFADALAVAAADRAAQEDLGRRIATGDVCVIVDADTVISPWLARDAVTASTAPADLGEHDRQLAPA
ncbi:MAG: glycosyltransferase [Acidimicrobiales bacterium]|nr:glycosyltransferase [Acidimicrobiales bacterium]MCB9395816.1 glycosyltransferase [Acidimicrobiaceae bacterium]